MLKISFCFTFWTLARPASQAHPLARAARLSTHPGSVLAGPCRLLTHLLAHPPSRSSARLQKGVGMPGICFRGLMRRSFQGSIPRLPNCCLIFLQRQIRVNSERVERKIRHVFGPETCRFFFERRPKFGMFLASRSIQIFCHF